MVVDGYEVRRFRACSLSFFYSCSSSIVASFFFSFDSALLVASAPNERSSSVCCAVLVPRLLNNDILSSAPLTFSVAMISSELTNKQQVQMDAAEALNPHSQPS